MSVLWTCATECVCVNQIGCVAVHLVKFWDFSVGVPECGVCTYMYPHAGRVQDL